MADKHMKICIISHEDNVNLKPQWDHKKAKTQKNNNTSCYFGQMELSYISGESVKWDRVLKILLDRVSKANQNFTPWYYPKRNEHIYPQKDFYKNVHDSLIHSI